MTQGKAPTGVRRLDDLLEGGLPARSATLVYGPPFIGKEMLTKKFLLAGCALGEPAIAVLTNGSASEVARQLLMADPEYPKYEDKGLAHFVDAYSQAIGAEEEHPNTAYVDGPMNLNALSNAVAQVERKAIKLGAGHRVAFDSLSTLLAYTNAQTTFRFLQVFAGKAKRAGATALYLLEQGMHPEAEVQMFKHLMDGVVECRTDGAKHMLHVQGAGVTESRGWVEYRYTDTDLDIVGSFASGRIK